VGDCSFTSWFHVVICYSSSNLKKTKATSYVKIIKLVRHEQKKYTQCEPSSCSYDFNKMYVDRDDTVGRTPALCSRGRRLQYRNQRPIKSARGFTLFHCSSKLERTPHKPRSCQNIVTWRSNKELCDFRDLSLMCAARFCSHWQAPVIGSLTDSTVLMAQLKISSQLHDKSQQWISNSYYSNQ
jgi:hypothetical protein